MIFTYPFALLLIPVVIAAAFFASMRFLHTILKMKKTKVVLRIFFLRTFLWTFSSLFLVIAIAGPQWGTKAKTVQKSGASVSVVLDISYSMLSRDMPPLRANVKSTRLEYAVEYVSQILKNLSGIPVSIVLVKGTSILAVPATEDYFSLYSLLSALKPEMLSSAGSDLGSGIITALHSFPRQNASQNTIILFTDGDETQPTLENAVKEAVKYGLHVLIIGFGTAKETQIIAGDGITKVNTALREQKLQLIAKTHKDVEYINALQTGSANTILQTVKKGSATIQYGSETIQRFMPFLIASMVFFVLGMIIGESVLLRTILNFSILLLFFLPLQSCSVQNIYIKTRILAGFFEWNKKNYNQAVINFLEAKQESQLYKNESVYEYAQYALGTTYLMQNEEEAALEKFEQIPDTAPAEVRFASFYNKGILAHRQGNYTLAAENFKKALLIDGTNTWAKINLELSLAQNNAQSVNSGQEQIQTHKKTTQDAEDTLFSIIKEKEQNQWKSEQEQSKSKNIIDY